uniref:Coiled-coil domain containing 81 n=1 Tax=Varanus komodoensis TaxID=61221 RepID=A0A8D2KRP7_VARKO
NLDRVGPSGVSIPGLGTFSFLRQKLEVGHNKYILLQRPVFLLSEKLAQIHGLKFNKIHTPGDIPIVQLNFIVLSLEGPFNREIVEGCIRETLLSFSRSIASKQTVEFTFKGIGVLVIRDNRVKMKFYKDFLQAMDGSGTLLKALSNDPVPGMPRALLIDRQVDEVLASIGTLHQVLAAAEWDSQATSALVCTEKVSMKRILSRQVISPAQVTGVSLTDELEKNMKPKLPPKTGAKMSKEISKCSSTSNNNVSHFVHLQEMCYLCMQRAQRNVPLNLSEERRRKEKEEERILAQYQAQKDQDALHRQLMRDMANREQNQKVAAFNLGVAEAVRSHKNEKPTETYKSFIFEKRPLSSTPQQKQEVYSQQLEKQLEDNVAKEVKRKQDQDLIDRLEQVQLAEELAVQRAKYLKDKMEEIQCYKRALDTQIKLRPALLPHCEPNSAEFVFGKNDMNKEKMEERKKRARHYSKCQLQASAERKRAAILSQLIDQRKEADMIQRAKKQWMAEKGERLERIFQMNLALQDDWRKSAELKRQRDYEEKLFQRAGDKLLLLDQCAKYRRCYQCKRSLSHNGGTNVWTSTKYVPGSRLMV